MYTVAITGSIGSGKSSALNYFKSLGYVTLSSDEVVHDLYASNRTIQQQIENIVQERIFYETTMNRPLLADIIFQDAKKKKQVEDVVHKAVLNEIENWRKQNHPELIGFVEIPLLFESGSQDRYDSTLMIAIDKEIQIKRLMKYRQLSLETIRSRLSHQMDQEKKRELAEVIIENNGSLTELHQKLDDYLEEVKSGLR